MSENKTQCPDCSGTGVVYRGEELIPEQCERCYSNGDLELNELSDEEFKSYERLQSNN